MRSLAAGAAAGSTIAILALTVGATAAAWVAIALSAVVIIVGAVDYVRTHG